ncbi:LytTR family DNA-binding domain-containing protein [Chitinimonas sp.]|uniref:LytTR family DNA-binding domain-containing protein n=1 Tax=Chitinimonas sp. TaxID=1934313 RepID=UPI002F93BC07
MPQDPRDLLTRYQPWRRTFEIGFWIVLLCSQAALNSVIVLLDVDRAHLDFAAWEPISWEWTSNLVVLALIPAILAFERRFPLQFSNLRRQLPYHLLASVVFSLVHVLAMVGLRKLIYLSQGAHYDFGNWPRELTYEYLKDARSYAFILLAVGCYRLLLLRLQGEASLLAAPDNGPAVEPVERPNRFLVKKLGKEFLLPAQEIEWLQAWGNYVNLRVRGHDYPLRSTMTAIEARLDPERFVRVHRSHIVNIHEVAEIEPLESGDARIRLRDGSMVPCSRTYRDALKAGVAA